MTIGQINIPNFIHILQVRISLHYQILHSVVTKFSRRFFFHQLEQEKGILQMGRKKFASEEKKSNVGIFKNANFIARGYFFIHLTPDRNNNFSEKWQIGHRLYITENKFHFLYIPALIFVNHEYFFYRLFFYIRIRSTVGLSVGTSNLFSTYIAHVLFFFGQNIRPLILHVSITYNAPHKQRKYLFSRPTTDDKFQIYTCKHVVLRPLLTDRRKLVIKNVTEYI